MQEIRKRQPEADPVRGGAYFVFTVSAMLSICTSRWQIAALAGEEPPRNSLPDFCEAGCETGTRA